VRKCGVFVVVFFCLFDGHAPSLEHRAFEGCIVRTSIALPFIIRFRRGFQHFLHKGLLFQTEHTCIVLYSFADGQVLLIGYDFAFVYLPVTAVGEFG